MTIYVDSSFLVSCYLTDIHSHEADRRMATSPDVFISPFNRYELSVAIFRQAFVKRVVLPVAVQAFGNFEANCRSGVWKVIPFPSAAWETSIDLARKYGPTLGVRTLDSLHVACALELKAQKFWTFDDRQARLAEAVGLDTTA